MHWKIKDRFDLTLECIRRHYANEPSPLTDVLARYADFFDLFENFAGYVEFFLLQDLVTTECRRINFFLPFDDFQRPPLPQVLAEYRTYSRKLTAFVFARNTRIDEQAR